MTNETSGNENRSYRDHFLILITDGFLVQIYLYLSHHVRSMIGHLYTSSCQLTMETGTHIHQEHWSIDSLSCAMVRQIQRDRGELDIWMTGIPRPLHLYRAHEILIWTPLDSSYKSFMWVHVVM